MSQYTGSYETDACAGNKCGPMFSAASSLTQGTEFASLTKDFHGGKSRSRNRRQNKNRKSSRMNMRKNVSRKRCLRKRMRGGSAEYPNSFQELLPQNLHAAANITSQDNAFAQLPKFIGTYGSMTGGNRTRKMRGGVAPVDAPGMILTKGEEGAAFLNPQWYTENQVVPSFKGPENALAAQQYATQFAYTQKAGGKRSRKGNRKSERKSRSNSWWPF